VQRRPCIRLARGKFQLANQDSAGGKNPSVQGRVVRKPVNANPGLKVNRGSNSFCIEVLYIAYVLCSLRLIMLNTEGQKYKQNSLLKSYKIEIKILANPGLA